VQRALELEPDFWIALLVRGGLALDRGAVAAALADLERSAARSGRASQVLAVLASARVAAGERAQAQAILRELQARDAAGYVPATSLAAVHNALGDTDVALDLLERAYREHDIRMAFLKVDARWNNLRSQPRFRALARRMGLDADHATGRF
jgi:serine/threonine-protein kinase